MNEKFDIVFYNDAQGNSPMMDFLDSLRNKNDQRSRALANAIYRKLMHLRLNGTLNGMPDFRKIENTKRHPIWEIRIKHVNGYRRIFICIWRGNTYIILNHFAKKTDKTPTREIAIAESMMDDYIRQMEGD